MDHPMEDQVVVVAVLGMRDEVLTSLGALLDEEVDMDFTHGGLHDGLCASV